MIGPKVGVHLDANANVVYGWQKGLRLVSIDRSFEFKNKVWLLISWEGYDLLEAVPFALLPRKFHPIVIEFLNRNDNNQIDFLKSLKMN